MLTEEEAQGIVLESAALRKKQDFRRAIGYVSQHLGRFPEVYRVNALLELVQAAEAGGFQGEAVSYARQLSLIDPEIPTVKRVLGK